MAATIGSEPIIQLSKLSLHSYKIKALLFNLLHCCALEIREISKMPVGLANMDTL